MATGRKLTLWKVGVVCLLYALYLTSCTLEAARSNMDVNDLENTYMGRRPGRDRGPKRERSEKPNIVLILTDDQDEMLGSMETMTKTLKLLQSEGVRFKNSFVTTPMCCPSRSTLLTGMYPHNHHVYTNNDNCSGIMWQQTHEPRTFAKYLSDVGYRTGYFGKYLNEYNGTYQPQGWRSWMGLIRNSRFYNYTVNNNGFRMKYGDNYFADYFTDLIANKSVMFFNQSKTIAPSKPVLMVLSVPAPHGPEDSAPQYQHLFKNNTLHRTQSWNYMNNTDKQWLVQQMRPLTPTAVKFVDMLQQKRLQTLQSVDDMVEKVYKTLEQHGELDNTYIIYTSDHGYHLGQYGIVKGKALPYDFDTRVPLIIRGPGVPKGVRIANIVGNADLAPTILDMAGVETPEHMDGRSILKLLKAARHPENFDQQKFVTSRKPWRDTVLIERGKVTGKQTKQLIKDQQLSFLDNLDEEGTKRVMELAPPKLRKMLKLCAEPSNQPPCKADQKWVCLSDKNKRRMIKCRIYNRTITGDEGGDPYSAEVEDEEFLGDEVELADDGLPDSHHVRKKRQSCRCNTGSQRIAMAERNFQEARRAELRRQKSYVQARTRSEYQRRFKRQRRSYSHQNVTVNDISRQLIAKQLAINKPRCRYLTDGTLQCDQSITQDVDKWKEHKLELDDMIKETRERLFNLKKLRRQMKKQRPDDADEFGDIDMSLIGRQEDCDCDSEEYPEEEEDFEEYLEEYGGDNTDGAEDTFIPQAAEVGGRKGRKKYRKRMCHSMDMKCSTQDNDHWKTPPYWTVSCKVADMDCTQMENDHWKTPPMWSDGPFCYCTNANNNTYWCLRTINQTHNFLYCEFISSFISFYDFIKDPYQLHNDIKNVNYGLIQQLHEQLVDLRACSGSKSCNMSSGEEKELKRSRRRRKIKGQKRRHSRHLHYDSDILTK